MYRLRCNCDEGSSFEVMSSAAPTSGFRERRRYSLALEHATPCVLVIDDVVIDCVYESVAHRWTWEPKFFAGTVLAELFDHHGTRLANYQLDVTPAPDKLGQALFAQILEDLLTSDPQLVFGSEAAQSMIGAQGTYGNLHLEYARLKMFGPQLLQSLRQLCADPLTRLRSDRQLVPPHRVRRFDQHSVRALARAPQMLAALRDASSPDRLLLDVPRSREELDTPAHRTLLSLLLMVARRVRKVRADLERAGIDERTTTFRTPASPRLAYRRKLLDDLELALRRQCRAAPFAAVRRAEVSAAGLNVIAGHPLYAAAYRSGWQILRPGIDGHREGELLAMSPTWEIYERWCFLRLTHALRGLFPALSWKRRSVAGRIDRIVETGTGDGQVVTAYLQKTFRAMDKKSGSSRFYSISSERRPDIVVTCTIAGHQRFIVFDPKYSVARASVLGAMEAAHIYRDCLRWDGRAPDLTLLLIPAAGEAGWLEVPSFHAEHRVGVLPLSPGNGEEQLRSLLEQVLFTK